MESIITIKSKCFALRIVRLHKYIKQEYQEYDMSRQILRSGTSIGANVVEAICGFSKKDFLAKMYIAFKESAETIYWLEILHESGYINEKMYDSLYKDALELKKILSSITKTTAYKLRVKIEDVSTELLIPNS